MLARILLFIFIAITAIGCGREYSTADDNVREAVVISAAKTLPTPVPETTLDSESEYKGVTIDQIFPITEQISAIDDDGRESYAKLEAGGHVLKIEDYVPRTLERNAEVIFKFKQREPGGYWATLAGTSHLLGPGSTQIYAVVSGPFGVCCTNYSIVDVSSGRPKSIFHSEDFGGFRNPMEIFDADGDGIYELVQFDSCFRYFMDDCGSCSPEPRAYFKYAKAKGQYLPTTGVVQDFVREGHQRSDQWLAEKFNELKRTGDIGLSLDIRRSALAHMVDLLYVGEEKRAWEVFDKYIADPKGETRREIKKRLAGCKFYQALKRR
ncbi:MAG TPA: hypothetical protein PKD24_04210 [Pyrinomonadaceae bacterium]|nr:hypothetical protein [Pyrinomonadaceae bacterium]HMP64754.1 hypothetical protein [Pyrinomonadaceae bacterium]